MGALTPPLVTLVKVNRSLFEELPRYQRWLDIADEAEARERLKNSAELSASAPNLTE